MIELPAELAALADALEIVADGRAHRCACGSILAAAPRRVLVVVPPSVRLDWTRIPAGSGRDSLELVRDFDGYEPAREWSPLSVPGPDDWQEIGAADSIMYESGKINGGGVGNRDLYRHEFAAGALAYRAPGGWFCVVGPKIRVSSRGIVN